MKKLMKMMFMAMTAVAITVGFAACSSNDDDPGLYLEESKQIAYGKLAIDLTFSDDLLSVADFTVHYTDADGQEKAEPISSNTFKKDIAFPTSSFPRTVTFYLTCTIKENYPTKEKYNITLLDESGIFLINKKGEQSSIIASPYTKKAQSIKDVTGYINILNKYTFKHKLVVTMSKNGLTKNEQAS